MLSKRIKIVLLCVLALVGLSFPLASITTSYFEISKNLDIFTSMLKELDSYYVDEIDAAKSMRYAMDGMLEKLDPYTNYISEAEMEGYKLQTTGKYGGIGATIRKEKEYISINEPYEGFPASKAGLITGDIILEIEGKSMKGKESEAVSDLLRGAPGTSVTVKISRPLRNETFSKTITREEIKLKSVPYYGMLKDGIGYIRLNQFTDNCTREVSNALKELKANTTLRGLVLDLRGNPGGLLNEAVSMCNLFVEKEQLVVSTKGKVATWDKAYKTMSEPTDLNLPLVVLTSHGSASASEIVSGVMQDYDRGLVVGQNTYGKGLVQTTRNLSYGTKLKLTTAKYYIPSGRCIQAIDYSQRNEDGSVGKVADSLKTAFKTRNGRKVYDGGGVAPDVALLPREYANVTIGLLQKQLIFEYASLYKSKHQSIAKARDFSLTEAEYEEFLVWLQSQKLDYTTKSDELVKKLMEQAEKDKMDAATIAEIVALKNKLNADKANDLIQHRSDVKETLENEIVSRYYFQAGRIEKSLVSDVEAIEAIKLLEDTERYQKILRGN